MTSVRNARHNLPLSTVLHADYGIRALSSAAVPNYLSAGISSLICIVQLVYASIRQHLCWSRWDSNELYRCRKDLPLLLVWGSRCRSNFIRATRWSVLGPRNGAVGYVETDFSLLR
eukprot:6163542-Pleurochrysis_carterae.AAC.3